MTKMLINGKEEDINFIDGVFQDGYLAGLFWKSVNKCDGIGELVHDEQSENPYIEKSIPWTLFKAGFMQALK